MQNRPPANQYPWRYGQGGACGPKLTYVDTFELHDGGWRLASREINPRLFGDISHHVSSTAGAAH